jgi:hypothetical protein
MIAKSISQQSMILQKNKSIEKKNTRDLRSPIMGKIGNWAHLKPFGHQWFRSLSGGLDVLFQKVQDHIPTWCHL